MTTDEKLAAILAAVQTDPGNRGLARHPDDNLFTACPGDFAAACRFLAADPPPEVLLVTGFFIPVGTPPAHETDGPLGAVFLARALHHLGHAAYAEAEPGAARAVRAGLLAAGAPAGDCEPVPSDGGRGWHGVNLPLPCRRGAPVFLAIERPGPAADGRCYTMRGRDITAEMTSVTAAFTTPERKWQTIGIGDGGNEIGMGKIHPDTVAKNIPNGNLIHCRVPTDHLVVAGVSNWGAYALAAGVYVLRGQKPPPDLFDPDREREILVVMVREGPLVDGVTGKQTATVDGLTWDEYAEPLVRIREILEA